jgi:serine protease AprX
LICYWWGMHARKTDKRRSRFHKPEDAAMIDKMPSVPPSLTGLSAPSYAHSPEPMDFISTPHAEDVMLFGAQDINENKKLPLILTSVSPDDREKLSRVLKEKFNGAITGDLPLVEGFTVEINPRKLQQFMKYLPASANVRVDNKIKYPDPQALIPTTDYKGPKDENKKPEETKNTFVDVLGLQKVWDKGYTGKGIGVCVIDSGIYSHEDLTITGWKDLSMAGKENNYDPFGHGTQVSGIIGGSGKASQGKIKGVAPDVNLIGVRITSVSEAIKGLQWAIENKDSKGIKIINMSLGDYAIKSYKDDPWAQAAEKAIQAGLIVFVAAGNEGPPEKTISTPGTDPLVMTVGAYDDKRTAKEDDDTLADFSSKGPTIDGLTKPNFLAPGKDIWGTLAPGSTLDIPDMDHLDDKYIRMSGTSQATPVGSGVGALLLSANPRLTQDQMMQILERTATRMPDLDENSQGKGKINVPAAIAMAEEMAKTGRTEVPSEGKNGPTKASVVPSRLPAANPGDWIV